MSRPRSFPLSWLRLAAAALALTLLPLAVRAQEAPGLGLSSYIGQNVSSTGIAGRPDTTFDSVQELIAVKPGRPLTQGDVDSSVARLKQHPGVNEVGLDLQPSADGVRVRFILEPALYVGMYRFPGALNEFSYTRLLQVANYNAQMPYSATDVTHAEDALVQFYRQQGYFRAEVRSQLEEDPEHGLVNV
ncbi:MAG TPA: POTRA domain-containing protein, partial [Candidatus Binatia bacterium]|nr:POTRA domain-containing protein [Candidatus Binatia bacterium]